MINVIRNSNTDIHSSCLPAHLSNNFNNFLGRDTNVCEVYTAVVLVLSRSQIKRNKIFKTHALLLLRNLKIERLGTKIQEIFGSKRGVQEKLRWP